MAVLLSTVPDVVNITHYGGDTLVIYVTAPSVLVDGKEWSAQIRSVRNTDTIDASFIITPPEATDGPAVLMLTSEDCSALLNGVTPLQVRTSVGTLSWVLRYTGVWDVQIAGVGGTDPVTTLAQGTITIELDVTRPEP